MGRRGGEKKVNAPLPRSPIPIGRQGFSPFNSLSTVSLYERVAPDIAYKSPRCLPVGMARFEANLTLSRDDPVGPNLSLLFGWRARIGQTGFLGS